MGPDRALLLYQTKGPLTYGAALRGQRDSSSSCVGMVPPTEDAARRGGRSRRGEGGRLVAYLSAPVPNTAGAGNDRHTARAFR